MTAHAMELPQRHRRIAVVVPVMNDWACLRRLLIDLAAFQVPLSVFAVDDGSTERYDIEALTDGLGPSISLEVVRLSCNLGHQRAIAVGLCVVAGRGNFDAAVVCDADGEDKPSDLVALIAASEKHPEAIIVAQRKQRSEGLDFRAFYRVYKLLFKVMTGKAIDFGNFCLIPAEQLDRITHMPELWNHLAATVVRSRMPVVRLATNRGTRYVGQSSMRLVNLLALGLSAISVFSDFLFVRLFLFCSTIAFVACGLGIAALVIKYTTPLAVPNWATTVIGMSGIVLFQTMTLLAVGVFIMLANRSSVPMVPRIHAIQFISRIESASRDPR